jgi:hypothetical protein
MNRRVNTSARGLSVSRFAHPSMLIGRFRLQVNPQRNLCLAGCGLAADVRVTDESERTMWNFRQTIQTVRKRWARRRSKGPAPSTDGRRYRASTPPPVVDPRVRSRRRLPQ